ARTKQHAPRRSAPPGGGRSEGARPPGRGGGRRGGELRRGGHAGHRRPHGPRARRHGVLLRLSQRSPAPCHTCGVNSGRILWVAGAYFAGVSFTFLIVKLKGSSAVAAAAARDRSEADAHILIRDHIGVGWMVLAATIDGTNAGLSPP